MGKPTQLPTTSNFVNEQSMINQQLESQKNNVQSLYGYSSSGSPTKGLTPLEDKSKLSKLGGRMQGALGFSHNQTVISSGSISLDDNNGVTSSAKSFLSILTESALPTDTLDNITGRKYEGQILIITNGLSGSTITLTDGAGGVGGMACPDGVDLSLPYPNSAILIDDPTFGTQTWRVIGTAIGGGGSWVGTATSDLDMGGFDIINIDDIKMAVGDKYFFDGGTDTYMTGSATSGRINVYNNTVNVTSFLTSGLLTTNITCADITTTGDIDINGNLLYLDSDRDTSISSTSDDNIQFTTGANVRVALSNSAITSTIPLTMSGNDINGVDILYFQDPSSGAIPVSGSVGIGAVTGDMYLNVLSADSYFFRVAGTTEVEIDADGIDIRNGWLELEERSAPAGLTNHARLYAKDNGAGKTQLVVIFGSGAEQVIATEP